MVLSLIILLCAAFALVFMIISGMYMYHLLKVHFGNCICIPMCSVFGIFCLYVLFVIFKICMFFISTTEFVF